jgi:hypothetical protein
MKGRRLCLEFFVAAETVTHCGDVEPVALAADEVVFAVAATAKRTPWLSVMGLPAHL